MAGKKRRKQNEADLAPDAFLEQGGAWVPWIEKNFLRLLAILLAALGLVLLVQYLGSQSSRANAAVGTDLRAALDSFREATDPRTALTATRAEALHEGYQGAIDKLSAFRNANADHPSKRLAGLYEAQLSLRLERYTHAEQLFEAYVSEADLSDPATFLALEGQGYALEAQQKWDAALEAFRQLEKIGFYKDFALKHQARVALSKGDPKAAVLAYQGIIDMEPASSLKQWAVTEKTALGESSP